MGSPAFYLGMVVILLTIRLHGSRRPYSRLGVTGSRIRGAQA